MEVKGILGADRPKRSHNILLAVGQNIASLAGRETAIHSSIGKIALTI